MIKGIGTIVRMKKNGRIMQEQPSKKAALEGSSENERSVVQVIQQYENKIEQITKQYEDKLRYLEKESSKGTDNTQYGYSQEAS